MRHLIESIRINLIEWGDWIDIKLLENSSVTRHSQTDSEVQLRHFLIQYIGFSTYNNSASVLGHVPAKACLKMRNQQSVQ